MVSRKAFFKVRFTVQFKLIRAVLEYIFMVGLPIVGIVFMLKAGESLAVPVDLGKTWELQGGSPTECYDLQFPTTLHLQQSGRFLHAEFGEHSAQGKLDDGAFYLNFTPEKGPCADKEVSLHGNVQVDSGIWPAVLESHACQQCEPVQIMIQLEEVTPL